MKSFIFRISTVFHHVIFESFIFRIHEFENKEAVTPAANEYIASAPDSNAENPDITSAQQSEVGRADLLDVTNSTEYNLSSDYVTSSAVQPEPTVQTYLQDNRQMQNISPLSNFMVYAYLLSWFIYKNFHWYVVTFYICTCKFRVVIVLVHHIYHHVDAK